MLSRRLRATRGPGRRPRTPPTVAESSLQPSGLEVDHLTDGERRAAPTHPAAGSARGEVSEVKQPQPFLLAAFTVAFASVGAIYWRVPYSRADVTSIGAWGAAIVGTLTAAAIIAGRCRFWPSVLALAGSVPAVVATRVVFDGMRDPTSHNLWPFELVFATVVGIAIALAGGVIGALVAWAVDGAAGEDA